MSSIEFSQINKCLFSSRSEFSLSLWFVLNSVRVGMVSSGMSSVHLSGFLYLVSVRYSN